jgi:hypothetical protein
MILLRDLILVKTCLCVLRFQCINASYVEVVAQIRRRVFLRLVAKMND